MSLKQRGVLSLCLRGFFWTARHCQASCILERNESLGREDEE